MKGNMNKKTHLTGLMHDSKWVRIFALIIGVRVIAHQKIADISAPLDRWATIK